MDHLEELAKKKCNFCSATDCKSERKNRNISKMQKTKARYFAKETEKAEKKDLFFAIRHS